MSLEEIKTARAPEAIGPYSQAIRSENWLFLSGQIPLHPESGRIVGDNIEEQTRQVLENLKAVLAAAGLDLSRVAQVTVYLADLNEFSRFNKAYENFFTPPYPARATVQAAALPKGVKVEISLIACGA